MRRFKGVGILSLIVLGACDTPAPTTNRVGSGDYSSYMNETARRDQVAEDQSGIRTVLSQARPTPVVAAPRQNMATNTSGQVAEKISAPLNATAFGYGATAVLPTDHAQTEAFSTDHLSALLDRVDILSGERIGAAAADALASFDGLDPVTKFALSTTHAIGKALYLRGAVTLLDSVTACEGYERSDVAQLAFLTAGGPENDPRGLDSDGDGYACTWDPRPYRMALR